MGTSRTKNRVLGLENADLTPFTGCMVPCQNQERQNYATIRTLNHSPNFNPIPNPIPYTLL